MKLRGHPVAWAGLGGAAAFLLFQYLGRRDTAVSTRTYMGPITVSPRTQGVITLGALPAGSFRGQLGTAVNLQGIPSDLGARSRALPYNLDHPTAMPTWMPHWTIHPSLANDTMPHFVVDQPTAQTRYSSNLVHRLRGGRTLTHRR